MDVDDILNESDDSSTSKEDESEPSQEEEALAEEVKAPFALEGEDFPPATDTNSVEVE